MKKTVTVRIFTADGAYVNEEHFEFESKYNRPRKTFMPDASEQFLRCLKDRDERVASIRATLIENPGGYILLDDRYGYPVLIPPETPEGVS